MADDETPIDTEVVDDSKLPVLAGPGPDAYRPFQGAGESPVTEAEAEALMALFLDGEHDIKPTGEVFVPQVHYRRRLNQVFRPLGWALVEIGALQKGQKEDTGTITFAQRFHFVVRGRFAASVVAEMDYNPRNDNTTEATALEGLRSNAVMRACKDLSIGWECWDKPWLEGWKKRMAVHAWTVNVNKNARNKGQKKKFWRRKDRAPFTWPFSEKAAERGGAGGEEDEGP